MAGIVPSPAGSGPGVRRRCGFSPRRWPRPGRSRTRSPPDPAAPRAGRCRAWVRGRRPRRAARAPGRGNISPVLPAGRLRARIAVRSPVGDPPARRPKITGHHAGRWPKELAGTIGNASDRYCVEVTVALDHEGDEGEGGPADPSGDLPAALGGE